MMSKILVCFLEILYCIDISKFRIKRRNFAQFLMVKSRRKKISSSITPNVYILKKMFYKDFDYTRDPIMRRSRTYSEIKYSESDSIKKV